MSASWSEVEVYIFETNNPAPPSPQKKYEIGGGPS